MPRTTDEIMREYYEILAAGAQAYDEGRRMRPLLATELEFEGPIAGRIIGADLFVEGVAGFIATVQSISMLHELRTDDAAATLYDAQMPGGVVRLAEFHRIDAGKIQSLSLLYDPAEYTSRGGR